MELPPSYVGPIEETFPNNATVVEPAGHLSGGHTVVLLSASDERIPAGLQQIAEQAITPPVHESRTSCDRERRLRDPDSMLSRLEEWRQLESRVGLVKVAISNKCSIDELFRQKISVAGPVAGEAREEKSVGGCHVLVSQLLNKKSTKLKAMPQEDRYVTDTMLVADGILVPFFAICDGHSGSGASTFLREHMRECLQQAFQECCPGSLPQDPIARLRVIDNALLLTSIKLEDGLEARNKSRDNLIQETITLLSKAQARDGATLTDLTPSVRRQLQDVKKSLFELQKSTFLQPIVDQLNMVLTRNCTSLSEEDMQSLLDRCHLLLDPNQWGGSTMTMALVFDDGIAAANVGDSRTVVVDPTGAHQLTRDASLDDEKVRDAVMRRGGSITGSSGKLRVENLETARSFEGRRLPAISARAKVTWYPRVSQGETTLILGCDGLVNYISPNEMKEVLERKRRDPSRAALLARIAEKRGSVDDISCMVVDIPARHLSL